MCLVVPNLISNPTNNKSNHFKECNAISTEIKRVKSDIITSKEYLKNS
jgi:hypothetical protein